MAQLSSRELRAALETLHAIGEACDGSAELARRAVAALPALVPAELTTLSICDLVSGHRCVIGNPSDALGRKEIEIFDHFFFEHPLVRHHGGNPAATTRSIQELVPATAFRRSALYAEYYRPLGIEYVVAIPLFVDHRFLVSFVMQRGGRPFGGAELELLELVRPTLAALYRAGVALDQARESQTGAARPTQWHPGLTPLTAREREVLDWVVAGKTNRDIAAILATSPRTVAKHLENVFRKLGVETRTAAAMRARGEGSPRGEEPSMTIREPL